MKTTSFSTLMPEKFLKQLPRIISVAIADSAFCLTGKVDWVNMTIEDIVIKPGSQSSKTFKGLPPKWFAGLPQDLTLTAKVGEAVTQWEVSLIGMNFTTFLCQDIIIRREDGKIYSIIMADETNELVPDYEIRITAGLGYACPMIFPIGSSKGVNGRRPVVQEVKGITGHVGAVVLGAVFRDGEWKVAAQGETKIDEQGQLVKTWRAARYSIQNPDRPEPPAHGSVFASYEVALDPRFICAGKKPEGGLVKILFYEYDSEWQLPENQILVPITEFLTYGDGPGTAALFQWLVFRFGDLLPGLECNTLPAKLGFPNDTITPISVGVVKNGTWSVLVRDGEMYDHNGQTFSCLLGYGFDDTKLDAVSVRHQFNEFDPNTKRESSVDAPIGALPVEVHEFQQSDLPQNLSGYKAESLGDFAQDGDGLAQVAVAKWLWHLYGDQLATIDPRAGSGLPAITN